MAVGPDGAISPMPDASSSWIRWDGSGTPLVASEAVAMTLEGIVRREDQLILTGSSRAVGVQLPNGQEVWRIKTPEGVAPAAVTSNLLVVAIDTGAAVFDIPDQVAQPRTGSSN